MQTKKVETKRDPLEAIAEAIQKGDEAARNIADTAAETLETLIQDFVSLPDRRIAAAVRDYYNDDKSLDPEVAEDATAFARIQFVTEIIEDWYADEDGCDEDEEDDFDGEWTIDGDEDDDCPLSAILSAFSGSASNIEIKRTTDDDGNTTEIISITV